MPNHLHELPTIAYTNNLTTMRAELLLLLVALILTSHVSVGLGGEQAVYGIEHDDRRGDGGSYATGPPISRVPGRPEQLALDSDETAYRVYALTHNVDIIPQEGFIVEADGLLRIFNGTYLCDYYDGAESCVEFGGWVKPEQRRELQSLSTHHIMDLAVYNYQSESRKMKIEAVHTIGAIASDVQWRSNDCGRKTSGLNNLEESIACNIAPQAPKVLQLDLVANAAASKQCAEYSFVLPYTANWRQAKFNWIINAPATLGDISLVAQTSKCAPSLSTIPDTDTLQELAADYLGFGGNACTEQYLQCTERLYTIGGALKNALSCTGDLMHNAIDGRAFAIIEVCSTAGY